MEFEEYEREALRVKLYHDTEITPLFSKITYLFMGLSGETGELGEKLKKVIRDKNCILEEYDKSLIIKELGDIYWYLTAIMNELGITQDEVLKVNLEKIQDRIQRGVLQGNGDLR